MNPNDVEHLLVAGVVSVWSKSKIVKVGAVLVHEDGNQSQGYNGQGYDGAIETYNRETREYVTKPGVIHAEAAAIAEAAYYGRLTRGSTMYLTMAPCFACAELMRHAGIKRLVYRDPWWDKAVLYYLKREGVKIKRIKSSELYE